MKIVIAPNAFKDSLSAVQISRIIAERAASLIPKANLIQLPVADGGDGLIDIASYTLQGERIKCTVRDPLGRTMVSEFCYIDEQKTAIIEMASASGLRLLKDSERNPMITSTKGTGDLIKAALDLGAKNILIGLGGSATNDGGCGMASVLGYRFLDSDGTELEPCGEQLGKIATIETSTLDPRLKNTQISALCDVNNPLLGEKGASRVYGPQKGGTPENVLILEAGMNNLANRIRENLLKTVHNIDYAGAAGGFGAGAYAFLNAELRLGIDMVLELIRFDEMLENCDLVITGEGKIDEQTVFGKAPAGVAARAANKNIPCMAIAGSRGLSLPDLHQAGFTSIFSICPGPVSLESALENAQSYLETATDQILRCFLAGKTGDNTLDALAVE